MTIAIVNQKLAALIALIDPAKMVKGKRNYYGADFEAARERLTTYVLDTFPEVVKFDIRTRENLNKLDAVMKTDVDGHTISDNIDTSIILSVIYRILLGRFMTTINTKHAPAYVRWVEAMRKTTESAELIEIINLDLAAVVSNIEKTHNGVAVFKEGYDHLTEIDALIGFILERFPEVAEVDLKKDYEMKHLYTVMNTHFVDNKISTDIGTRYVMGVVLRQLFGIHRVWITPTESYNYQRYLDLVSQIGSFGKNLIDNPLEHLYGVDIQPEGK